MHTACTTYHIYPRKEKHEHILSTPALKYESPYGKFKRAAKQAKQEAAEKTLVVEANPVSAQSDDAFFLHSPCLVFRSVSRVVYLGADKRAEPGVLIHGSSFWRRYKLQYGRAIAEPGVVGPRGVVCWKHNSGDKKALEADDKKLRGYKVKTWRLWGETGKAYVHEVKAMRKTGSGDDPNVLGESSSWARQAPAEADGVVHLEWERPFSLHTRQYHFRYFDLEVYWKGTRKVNKGRFWGIFVRYNHLKLVVTLPSWDADTEEPKELCLARYTSSVTSKKSGKLDLYDGAIAAVIENCAQEHDAADVGEDHLGDVGKLKRTFLYQIVLKTALCKIGAEKEKRVAVGKWLEEAAEGAGV